MKKYGSLWSLLFAFEVGLAILPPHAAAQTGAPNEWTWMGGSSTVVGSGGQPGVYGTLGMPAPGNNPGGREYATSWTDKSGNFWLFGGNGVDANGNSTSPNDLWKFNPETNEWAWMSGSNALGQSAMYGTLGSPASGNIPGSRSGAVSWTDRSGNLWLFGGFGVDASGNGGDLNDLWEFNTATNEWAWMGGSSMVEACFSVDDGYINCGLSVPGTLGTPAAGNAPGGREWATNWTDSNGNFWLFGGNGFDPNGNYCYLDDLWEFNPSTNEWAWISGGSSTTSCEDDSGGGVIIHSGFWSESRKKEQTGSRARAAAAPEIAAPASTPAGRYGASNWTDDSGHLWLFGGWGISGFLNDLWEFDPAANQWTSIEGASAADQPGVYGTLGTAAQGNIPGAREYALSWTDTFGNLWLYGGSGLDGTGNGTAGHLGDLWEFNTSTKLWTWMSGNSAMSCATNSVYGPVCFQPGEYGTLGAPAAGNVPVGRYGAVGWIDTQDNIWLFGGFLIDANVEGLLNDLWKYQPYAIAATPAFSEAAGTYTTAQAVTISDATPGATVYYTIDGTTPITSSAVYGGPILVASTETLEAVALANGYAASAVTTATYTIPPDFTLAINPASLSVQSGQSGTTTIVVQDEGGFNGNVSFVCSGLPQGTACSFAIDPVPTPVGITYWTLTVTISVTTATLHRNYNPLFPGTALAAVLCCFGWKKRRRSQTLVLLGVSVFGLGLLAGCGASGPPAPVTSTVTVTATSGALQHTTNFTLTVN